MNDKCYAVVFENRPWFQLGAYVPDLPGRVSPGATLEEAEQNIREAISLHLEGMGEGGIPIPEATSFARMVEVA